MEEELEQRRTRGLIKIVLFGPESTGKTTLSQMLADHYKTQWVPEYMREYLQKKWDEQQKTCEPHDLLPIARGQMALENHIGNKSGELIFCDTNLLELVVYSRAYYEETVNPVLLKHALKAEYDLYFLTYIDVPWVKDDLRDRPGDRDEMFARFKNTLEEHNLPYRILEGDLQQRFQTAVKIIDQLKTKTLNFSEKDVSRFREKGITPEKVEQQIEIFKRGNIVVNVREAATVKNGILAIPEEKQKELSSFYESKKDGLDLLKFVPASGAATRMFKAFYNLLKEFDPNEESLDNYIDRKNEKSLEVFFSRIKDLPFYEKVRKRASEAEAGYDALPEDKQHYLFVKYMLQEDGLNLGDQPKGLVPFHKYQDHLATAFEEHLVEAIDYAAAGKKVRVHFTVAEEHREKFEEEAGEVVPRLEKQTGYNFEISYSYQDPKTDTVAVTMDNEPFRDENGEIFFRPGGHGALIQNLNEQQADLIFIKNIDNVVIPKNRELLANYKKMLAGKLLQLQERIFSYMEQLESKVRDEQLEGMGEFLQKELNAGLSVNFKDLNEEEKPTVIKKLLNRPLRVCGMVKNEGEPGGGPFWVTHKNGEISLQIVESSQIDHDNYQQSKIANEATHFNPVDVVCSTRDYRGGKFDLNEYVDEDTSFIANKTKDGKELKALELPGLWNGGMAHWNTIFVEVPVETFNPVKTVADLLKPSHQVQ